MPRMNLPYTMYSICGIYKDSASGEWNLCNSIQFVSGINPLTDREALARFVEEMETTWLAKKDNPADWKLLEGTLVRSATITA